MPEMPKYDLNMILIFRLRSRVHQNAIGIIFHFLFSHIALRVDCFHHALKLQLYRVLTYNVSIHATLLPLAGLPPPLVRCRSPVVFESGIDFSVPSLVRGFSGLTSGFAGLTSKGLLCP